MKINLEKLILKKDLKKFIKKDKIKENCLKISKFHKNDLDIKQNMFSFYIITFFPQIFITKNISM